VTYIPGTATSGTTPAPTLTVPVGVTAGFQGLIVFSTSSSTDWDPVPAKAGATFTLLDDRAAGNLRVTVWAVTGLVAGDVITTSATINGACNIWHAYQDQYTYDVVSVAPAIRSGSSAVSVSGTASPATGQPVAVVAVERTTATGSVTSSVVSSGGETVTQRLFSEETATVSSTYIGDFTASAAGTRTVTLTYNTASGNGYAALITGTPIVAPIPPTFGPHNRFFRNYDYSLMSLTADLRGFLVGQSRLGVTRLRSTLGAITSVKGGFTSITSAASMRIVDGAWLEPDVSSLTLITRDRAAFMTYDSAELALSYDGHVVFSGYVIDSQLVSEINEDNVEEFSVQLTARGYEAIKVGQPAVGTITARWIIGGGPGGGPVVQWAAGKVRRRAADLTGRTITAEDATADVQLEEPVDIENDLTGTQGELLAELAIRSGLLLDQTSGNGVAFRSYQKAPLWQLEDAHLISGYGLALDRDTAAALVLSRKEDPAYVRAWRAGRDAVTASHTISMPGGSLEVLAARWSAYVPLQATPKLFLTGASLPRSDDLVPPSRLPIEARFRHGGVTYRAAVVALSHQITPVRWSMSLTGAPVHLITRMGDLAPTAPAHVKGSLVGTTVTLTWTTETAGVTTTTGSSSTFVVATATAANIDVGDDLRLYSAAGALKEDTIFRVTAKAAPAGGNVAMTVSPAITATQAIGDVLRYNDYGVNPDGGWEVFYKNIAIIDDKLVSAAVASNSVKTFTNSAVVTGLSASSTYRFTVFAIGALTSVNSPPSNYVEIVVP
jgi:hypothetical protein